MDAAVTSTLLHLVLWIAGLTLGGLATWATYRILRHGRGWVAAVLVIAVYFPLLVLAAGGVYASLVVSALL
jgi:hypothetical protein